MPKTSKSQIITKKTSSGLELTKRRLPKNRAPTHPGEMLLEEFLKPLGVSQSAFAIQLGVSYPRLNEIIHGKRGVTSEHYAWPKYWGCLRTSGWAFNQIGISGMHYIVKNLSKLQHWNPYLRSNKHESLSGTSTHLKNGRSDTIARFLNINFNFQILP